MDFPEPEEIFDAYGNSRKGGGGRGSMELMISIAAFIFIFAYLVGAFDEEAPNEELPDYLKDGYVSPYVFENDRQTEWEREEEERERKREKEERTEAAIHARQKNYREHNEFQSVIYKGRGMKWTHGLREKVGVGNLDRLSIDVVYKNQPAQIIYKAFGPPDDVLENFFFHNNDAWVYYGMNIQTKNSPSGRVVFVIYEGRVHEVYFHHSW